MSMFISSSQGGSGAGISAGTPPNDPVPTDETTALDHLASETTYTVSGSLDDGPLDGVIQISLSKADGGIVPVTGGTNNEGHLLRASDGYPQSFSLGFDSPSDVTGFQLRILSATSGWDITHSITGQPSSDPPPSTFEELPTIDKAKSVAALPFSTTTEREEQFNKWDTIRTEWQAEGTGDTISSANAVADNQIFLQYFEWGAFDFDHRWADAYRDYLGWLAGSPPPAWPSPFGWSGFVNGFLSFRQWLINIQGANPGDYHDIQDDF